LDGARIGFFVGVIFVAQGGKKEDAAAFLDLAKKIVADNKGGAVVAGDIARAEYGRGNMEEGKKWLGMVKSGTTATDPVEDALNMSAQTLAEGKHFKEAEELAAKITDPTARCNCYSGLAMTYLDAGDKEGAGKIAGDGAGGQEGCAGS